MGVGLLLPGLGAGVVWGADLGPGQLVLGFRDFGGVEVGEFVALGGLQDVRGFYVAVGDAVTVQVFQSWVSGGLVPLEMSVRMRQS